MGLRDTLTTPHQDLLRGMEMFAVGVETQRVVTMTTMITVAAVAMKVGLKVVEIALVEDLVSVKWDTCCLVSQRLLGNVIYCVYSLGNNMSGHVSNSSLAVSDTLCVRVGVS